MGKASEPGRVKTRLVPPLRPEEAARLNGAMIRATLRRMAGPDWDVELHLAGNPRVGDGLLGIPVIAQTGQDLGERMSAAVTHGFAQGYSAVVLIGSDHPTVPVAHLETAFRALEASGDMVIGPSEDGGYYLLGMTRLVPDVFEDMEFSVDTVFDETLRRVKGIGIPVVVLPEWYDIDQAPDLARLRHELARSPDGDAELQTVLEDIGP
ncbi:MAG: TIGR04282 family arsenosugar biosynthesis glycosyltransferase [Rhodothermales bacterium]